jgi:four helix bundle protein
MAYQSFEDLEVWKRACRLAVEVCKELHACREFALADQMRRSSVSIASNISEGAERDSPRDFIRFLRIAKGSSAELRTQLFISIELGVIEKSIAMTFVRETKEIGAMLQGLIRSLLDRTA